MPQHGTLQQGATRTRPRVATNTKERAPMQGVYQGLYNTDPPDVGALLDAVEAGNLNRVRELLDGDRIRGPNTEERLNRVLRKLI